MAVLRVSSATELAAAFVWGTDLSGAEQRAGGAGGLLFARFYPANNYNYTPPTLVYYGYDGNGNVTTLYNPASQSVAAVYEYDAFGQILRQTGPTAATNPFRFSTKFTDDESGLNYYGYRYYSPWMGRWISRDPIGEQGGINLYGMLSNSAVAAVDFLGKYDFLISRPPDGPYSQRVEKNYPMDCPTTSKPISPLDSRAREFDQNQDNCANYACDRPGGGEIPSNWQPTSCEKPCKKMLKEVIEEFRKKGLKVKRGYLNCLICYHKVRLWRRPDGTKNADGSDAGPDFHYTTQDKSIGDGNPNFWSEKRGRTKPVPVADPDVYISGGNVAYELCGEFCVEDRPKDVK